MKLHGKFQTTFIVLEYCHEKVMTIEVLVILPNKFSVKSFVTA